MNFKKSLSREELKYILSPQLRLFLSIDVVGSTAFKHRKVESEGSKPWLKFIHGFYTAFPEMCQNRVLEVEKEADPKPHLARPYLWKALGDELIFSVLVNHPSHVRHYLKAFRKSLIDAIQHWTEGENGLPISFKGTAWLAGFPVFNSAVPLDCGPTHAVDSEQFDYVGPLLDIGFRLSKFATPRRFVVSVDTAWVIAALEDAGGMTIHYHGREPLKGVLNDRPYPVFWIDCVDDENGASLDRLEDTILNRTPVELNSVRELAEAFLKAVAPAIPKPFFCHEEIPNGFQPPPGFDQRMECARGELMKNYEIIDREGDDSGDQTASESERSEADTLLKDVSEGRTSGTGTTVS
jgi:hypothetical protein